MTESFDQQIDQIARDCLAVRVRILNRVLSAIYDEALRPLGLKVSQMNLLVVAGRMGMARPADVCHLLQMDASTLSRNVERMRAKGWLETVPDESDGRSQPFRLAAQGRQLIEEAFPLWEQAQKKAEKLLSPGGSDSLRQAARQAGLQSPP
jgi:DNA-binding MarR family transcriptional regulator